MLNSFEDTLNAKLVKANGMVMPPPNYFGSVENLNRLWDISMDLTLMEYKSK